MSPVTFGKLAAAISAQASVAPTSHWHRPNHLSPLYSDAAFNFYGAESDSLPLTRAEAISVPAMARARHVICTPARLPLAVTPEAYENDALIRQPDPNRTRAAVHTDTLDSLLFHGSACWRVTDRYADGRPRRAEYVALHRLAMDRDSGWQLDDSPVSSSDLIWFEGPHEGILSLGRRALRAAVNLDRAYSATAQNPVVAAELHQLSGDQLSKDEQETLVSQTREAMRSRGVVYTNEALELKVHAAESENLLISGRQAAAVDIARTVGLPAPIIDAYAPGSSGTYQTFAARLREARDIGIDAYASAVTDRLSMDDILPRGVQCQYVWDQLLRGDFADRMAGYAAAAQTGVYTVEELRELERRTAAQERE